MRRNQPELSTVLRRFRITPREVKIEERLMKRRGDTHIVSVLYRDLLEEEWQRTEVERLAKKAAKGDK